MYVKLIKYFLDNNLYKSTNTNDAYIFKVVIANDFSKDQIISEKIINHIFITNTKNTSKNTNSINSSMLSIVDTITYINLLSEYVISNIFLHNNKNAFKKFVIDNTLLKIIKNNTKNNTDNYKSYSKALYLIYIKILTEGLYYENKFFLDYFKDTTQNSIFTKHFEKFIKLYNKNINDNYDLSLVFSKISKRFIIILFNFIKHKNANINFDKTNLLQYKFNGEPILLKFDYFNNEALKKINKLDDDSKENFFNFVMNVLNKDNLEEKLDKNYNNRKFFNFIIQMLKLYRNLENKFIVKDINTKKYKFVKTENTNIQQSQIDSNKIDYINSIIVKLNKSIKSILSKSLDKYKKEYITAEKNNNNNINYFSTYLKTVILDNNDTNIYSYNISTGIEINAGGPTKAFFTDLSKELSKYINNLRRLKEDFPYIKNTNLSRNSNRNNNKFNNSLKDPNISSSNIYYLGKMTARLLFIEKYDINLTLPDDLYNALIILLNNPKLILDNYKIIEDKLIKGNSNVTKEVVKNINDYLLLDKDEIFRILNSSNDDFIMEFSYSGIEGNYITGLTNSNGNGNVNPVKVEEFIKESQRNASELKQKLIKFYEESKFIEDMYVILNNSNYRKFFKGFLEIYVKVLSKNKNFLINDLIYLTDKNTLKESIENTVIATGDFISKLDFKYGNIPGTANTNNPYNKKEISANKDAVQKAFIEGIEAIAKHYENNTKNSSSSNNNAKKRLTKQDFFEDLLYFWTGSRVLPKDKLRIDFYMNQDKFNLLKRIKINNNSKNTSKNNSNNNINTFINTNKYQLIPKSHTCFNSIDMVAPINADDKYLKKYKKIITKLFKFGFEEGIFGATSFGAA